MIPAQPTKEQIQRARKALAEASTTPVWPVLEFQQKCLFAWLMLSGDDEAPATAEHVKELMARSEWQQTVAELVTEAINRTADRSTRN